MQEPDKKDDCTQSQPVTPVANPEAKEQGIPVASLSFLSNIQPDFWDSFD